MNRFIKLIVALVSAVALVLSSGCGGESGEISERELVGATPMKLNHRCASQGMPSPDEGHRVKGEKIATTQKASGLSNAKFRLETKDLEEQGKYLAIRAEDGITLVVVIVYQDAGPKCYSSGVVGGTSMATIAMQEDTVQQGDSIVIVASDSEPQSWSGVKPSTTKKQATPRRSTSTPTHRVP